VIAAAGITTSMLRLASTLSRLSLRSTPSGADGLDRLSVKPRKSTYLMAGRHEGPSRKDLSGAQKN
jgi:hypothetical protein